MAIQTDRLILYHIPKCGGTWVKVAMKNAGIRYRTPRWSEEPHPFNLKHAHSTPDNVTPRAKEGRFSFCFVRKPISWYQSYWAFRSRKGSRRDEKFPADGLWSDDFDQFVNNLLDTYPDGFVTTLYQYYTGAKCEKVDFVGRQEYLSLDLAYALGLAGEPCDVSAFATTPYQNMSPDRWISRAILSDTTRVRVTECERWVLERFYA